MSYRNYSNGTLSKSATKMDFLWSVMHGVGSSEQGTVMRNTHLVSLGQDG